LGVAAVVVVVVIVVGIVSTALMRNLDRGIVT